jgi:hypothetical protein
LTESAFGECSKPSLLVVVLVLVLGFSAVFEHEHDEEDENDRRTGFSKQVLSPASGRRENTAIGRRVCG